MRPPSLMLVLVVLVAPFVVLSTSAHAQRTDKRADAKTHYENGLRKLDVGKYDDAADEFVQAYELVGDPLILFNIAQSYRMGERFEKSAQFYRSFLRRVTDIPNRAEIEGRITEMDERAADQKRQADRKAAELREAEHKAEKTHPKHEPAAEDRSRPGRTLKIVGYTLCALTGVSLGVGIAMSVLATKASKTVQDAAGQADPAFTPDLQSTQSHGKTYDIVAIVGYSLAGAAAVGAGLSIYYGFRAERNAQAAEPITRVRRKVAWPILAPSIGRDRGGLVVVGRF